MYNEVDLNIDFAAHEESITAFWQENKTFKKSLSTRASNEEHIFYDGPPFPTGSPHHGSVFVSILKDCLARFYTMKGKYVPRAWGWDCHGLPIENAVEKLLGINKKLEIEEKIGVKGFNDECRKLVSNYNNAWEEYINRIGRWVDYKHPYRTLDKNYMESVIWVFGESYKKGLIYKDFRVTPYCYKCETSLSISDTRESDSTRLKQDSAIIIKFAAKNLIDNKPTYYLAWTTTPWTLVGNLALAVRKDIEYSVVVAGDEHWILAHNLVDKYEKLLKMKLPVIKNFSGAQMEGWEYEPIFPYYKNPQNDGYYRIILADFVTIDDGVGIVHIAPAFGEDDYWACRNNNIKIVNPVNNSGCFISEIKEFAGINVHAANNSIINMLKSRCVVVDHRTIDHNYPHCWRCRTPLIYYAMDAWYYDIEKIKDKLLEQNQKINWIPDTVKDGRFGKWLEGSRNWNISRNRFWGTPLPVWECSNPDCNNLWVASSCKELSEKAGYEITDLHKEFLDAIQFPCQCGGTMQRIPEVLDCWFESGSMPFAQCHYPFDNQEWFKTHFPADFIVEYTGQIRGWFYYLHVLAVAIMERPAFKNCLVHGTFLTADGSKMSKSLKNYTDPMVLLKKYGADAFRVYVLSSAATVMSDFNFVDDDIKKGFQTVIRPLWNAYYFFVTYANIDNYSGNPDFQPDSTNELDLWILSKLYKIEKAVKKAFETYYLDQYFAQLKQFIDDFTNWYIRRSRSRVWESGFSEDKRYCYDTLYCVLITLVKIMAPSLPFIAEQIYKNLTKEESIHLSYWPNINEKFNNPELDLKVELARTITALGLALRQKIKIKTRQPLRQIKIVLPQNIHAEILDSQLDVIKSELNVLTIDFIQNIESIAHVKAIVNARKCGSIYGKEIQLIIQAAKAGKIEMRGDKVLIKGKEKEWLLDAEDVTIGYESIEGSNVISEKGIVVLFNTEIDDELMEEGICNEITRHIQVIRKSAGYNIIDRIFLQIDGPLSDKSKKQITEVTLADIADVKNPEAEKELIINDVIYYIKIKKQ